MYQFFVRSQNVRADFAIVSGLWKLLYSIYSNKNADNAQFSNNFYLCLIVFSLTKNAKTQRQPSHRIRQNRYSHIVHPVFKKRSIDKMTPLDKFDLNLHRNSRHVLYKQINTFLKTYA